MRRPVTYRLESNRNDECVDGLHIRKDSEDSVAHESPRRGCDARLIDRHHVQRPTLHDYRRNLESVDHTLNENQRSRPFKRTRSRAVTNAQTFGAQYA